MVVTSLCSNMSNTLLRTPPATSGLLLSLTSVSARCYFIRAAGMRRGWCKLPRLSLSSSSSITLATVNGRIILFLLPPPPPHAWLSVCFSEWVWRRVFSMFLYTLAWTCGGCFLFTRLALRVRISPPDISTSPADPQNVSLTYSRAQ